MAARKKPVEPPPPPLTTEIDGVPHEHRRVQWGTLGVGSIVLDSRGRRWTCIAMAQPEQFTYARSCWLKFRAPNGEEFTAPPRLVNVLVTTLVDPDAPPIKPAWADGAEAAWLLATELGATELATQDRATGEVWCPDYSAPNPDRTGVEPLLVHLEVCHGIEVAALRAAVDADWADGHEQTHKAHEGAHHRPLGGGFPHRHVPEDHTIL